MTFVADQLTKPRVKRWMHRVAMESEVLHPLTKLEASVKGADLVSTS